MFGFPPALPDNVKLWFAERVFEPIGCGFTPDEPERGGGGAGDGDGYGKVLPNWIKEPAVKGGGVKFQDHNKLNSVRFDADHVHVFDGGKPRGGRRVRTYRELTIKTQGDTLTWASGSSGRKKHEWYGWD